MPGTAPQPPIFAVAALVPYVLILLGVTFGGFWSIAVLFYMAVLTAIMDQILRLAAPNSAEGSEFPAADGVLVLIACMHFTAFPLVVWAIAGNSGFATWEHVVLAIGAGQWFGQVANPCAHELIHRGNRGLYWLGVAIYASMLFGHHASAHRLVHHRFAATLDDPNTAREGESYYRFWLRAWVGSYMAGLRAETARRQGKGLHPYAVYAAISVFCLCFGYVIGGWGGVLAWMALAIFGHSQLLLADYVQHYGLLRKTRSNGTPEPVSERHSWNAPHWFTSTLSLNAPRHSDHHAHPSRAYPALSLPEKGAAPYLPLPLAMCCNIALVPRLWYRVIAKPLNRWRVQEEAWRE
ncbi:alkane 1-monooxygenase [Pseudorhodobacter sp.]|uniref:alkane 1-monooxygenase n=1 Tax=Pseudorhodobacter sp. TaxID=1934400 RepID=UPI002649A063|nr:alkane 1-monooxygenase [Pseudorhodobacter sp.]MDN5787205.1 alkane 1-monooxygenase [Pseudorhodobacter sp.]